MARRLVKVKDCDRCPVNKRRPATHADVLFGFGENKWKIDLCDQHYDMLSRDLYAWGLLGESLEDVDAPVQFGAAEERRRAARLRHQQVLQDRAVTTAPPIKLPHDHAEWSFSEHALERMEEREIDVVEVLWACTHPTLTRPDSHGRGLFVHERHLEGEPFTLHIVFDPKDKTIVTTAWRDANREAVGL